MNIGESNKYAPTNIKKEHIIIGSLLALSVLLMFVNFWYVSVHNEDDKRYISLAAELRILSQNIAKYASNAADGMQEAFELLRNRRDEFEKNIAILHHGDANIGLPPSSAQIKKHEILRLEETWRPVREKIDTILMRQNSLLELHSVVSTLSKTIAQVALEYDKVIEILLKDKAPADQVAAAGKEKWLAEKISRNLDKMIEGRQDSVEAAGAFSRQADLFASYLIAMREGNDSLHISKVTDEEARKLLNTISEIFSNIEINIQHLVKISEQLTIVRTASYEVFLGSQVLLDQSTELLQAYSKDNKSRLINPFTGYLLGGVVLLLLMTLLYRLYANAKKRLALTTFQHHTNRIAVLQLLGELSNLAHGDLTIHATVKEGITGAIAESVNYAINALRQLVFTINNTAVSVSHSAQSVQSTVRKLAKASENQANEIVHASAAINAMAISVEHVSSNATQSSAVAENSVNIAKNGVTIVQNTISGMGRIKEQIQETAKQVKRLGESSQEIGDIVSLIDDISDQTNILALNAAIQAAMAGEEGRGFAVVAEEVQRLAERSSHATKKIETLVRTIQNNTRETVKAIEQTSIEVVQGAKLTEDAGIALEKIENVSLHLAQLIQNISNEAQQQAKTAGKISTTMTVIQEIITQNASGTLSASAAINQLAELAIELRDSVAGFKLSKEESLLQKENAA